LAKESYHYHLLLVSEQALPFIFSMFQLSFLFLRATYPRVRSTAKLACDSIDYFRVLLPLQQLKMVWTSEGESTERILIGQSLASLVCGAVGDVGQSGS
jgi:hypothetical protein